MSNRHGLADLRSKLTPAQRELVERRLRGQAAGARPEIKRRAERDHAAMSFAQQRLWFLDQLRPGNPLYNVSAAFSLSGSGLKVEELEKSINELVRRHEILRTNFRSIDGEPVQMIAPELKLDLALKDLGHFPVGQRETEARRIAAEEAERPFDLEAGPLLRVNLLRLNEAEHVLLLVMHHIITDGWSMGIFFGELKAIYKACIEGKSSPLDEIAIHYADFAQWQREWLSGEVLDKQLSYWKTQLAGAPPVLELPTNHPRPAVQSHRGARVSKVLPASLVELLQQLSRKEDATLFMTLLAAFQTLLYRYSRQEDFCIGTSIANRNRAEIEPLIGFFVNTLVLRATMTGNPSFRELVRRVKEVCLGAYAHQDVPFEKLVEALEPERTLSHTPLFQVMMNLQNMKSGELELEGVRLEPLELDTQRAKFDLSLAIIEKGGETRASITYNTELFEGATIERMLGHFEVVLNGMVKNVNQRVGEVLLLTASEQEQLSEWNRTTAGYASGVCLHELFVAQVVRTPNAVAVRFGSEQLTYQQLNERANQLAHYLQARGVKTETRLGLCVERSIEMVVGVLGILKAGATYVPLDPLYPHARLAFMIADADVSVLLTREALLTQLPEHHAQLACLDTDWAEISRHSHEELETDVNAGNLSYIIYTSGSTGQPKGVMNSHGAICNHLLWRQATLPLTDADRFLQKASLSFDISVWEIFGPLIAGAQLILARPGGEQDTGYLVKLIKAQQITVAHFGPSMLHAFLQEEDVERCSDLRLVFCGGDTMPVDLAERFFARLNAELCSQYGPTEASVDVTFHVCSPASDRRVVPIGRPIANTEIYLLDSFLQPVPIGIPGELHIGGASLARGYSNRPDTTAEKFIPNSFVNAAGARLYKTGDQARYLSDGNIEFIGRLDNQVKVRGFRIELEEIEIALTEHPAVLECVVVADVVNDQRLIAYVVADTERPLGRHELQDYLKERLPAYMVPSAFAMLDQLPLTTSGKIDRRALPTAGGDGPSEIEFVGPRNLIEEVLVGIWCNLLGLEQVGIHDDFFDLGGHSLKATQVMSRVRAVLQVDLPLSVLFEMPTVSGLAGKIEQARQTEQGLQILPLAPVARSGHLALSFSQRRLWFLSQLEPGNHTYNVPHAIRLIGALNIDALQQTISKIIARHETLRTSFATRDGEPVQVIAPAEAVSLPLIDLSHVAANEREDRVRQLVMEHAEQPFDLEIGPLLRASLIWLGDEEHLLVLVMHHIITDGWSTGILLRELRLLYEAYSEAKDSPLEDLAIQYADFAHWQRAWLSGEILEKQIDFWKGRLAGVPAALELPTDHPRPAIRSNRGACHSWSFSTELIASLKRLSREEGATLFMTLLGAFQTLLYRYSNQGDFCIGADIANRNRTEVEPLIGFFVNMLVLRAEMSGNPTFRELLARVRETCLGAYAHQDMPFEKLVEELEPERALSHTPLFQVVMVLQNTPCETWELAGLRVEPYPIKWEKAKFDLVLTMKEAEDGLSAVMVYNTDLFERETIERMLRHLEVLLEEIASNPEQRVRELRLMTAEETEQQQEWNRTSAEFASEACLHELFEEQVKRTPAAVALVCEEERVSYRELNERSNQLAHHLRQTGVGPGMLVGILMERSIEMVTALLGVLKAGAAYVPLDPEYPSERLSFMIADANAPVLLTQEHLLSQLPQNGARMICLDRDWPQVSQRSRENPASGADPLNLAYVIYTSGSTGLPKGAMNSHRAIVNRLLWMQKAYGLDADDRVLQKTPFSFDVSVWEFFWPLLVGARLVMARPGGHRDSVYLTSSIIEQQITTLHFVPSMLHVFLEETGIEVGHNLRRVICSGEALDVALQEKFFKRLPTVELHNLYGPTEAAVDVTAWRCEAGSKARVVPIGTPISNVNIHLLDERLQPVPVGITGELFISGVSLAHGYWKRPGLTAEKFVPHPHSLEPGARLYRTGDIARYLKGGNIEYLGRIDHQVKLRGMRIELGEIEAVLSKHAAVQDAVLVAREYGPSDTRLVGYLVPDQQRAGVIRELLRLEGEELGAQLYELPNGLRIVHQNKSETDFLYAEIFERQTYLKYGIQLKPGACIFDVGANIGLFTLFMGRACEGANIYAFEPIPPLFKILEANAKIYGLNVKLFECGLSSVASSETFTYYPHCTILSGRFADQTEEAEVLKSYLLNEEEQQEDERLSSDNLVSELVRDRLSSEEYLGQLKTVSDIIEENEIEQIDLLKIDVEKSELDLIDGIKEHDWTKIRQVIVEVHDHEGRLSRVRTLLEKHGYELTIEQDSLLKDTQLYNVYAVRPFETVNDAPAPVQEKCWENPNQLIRDLQGYLQEKLPDYMVPAQFVLLDGLPLTPNGKIDRKALPAPDQSRSQLEQTFVSPGSPEEQILAGIFARVLKVDRVSIHDNFFELGGHSLLATQVASRIRRHFNLDVPLTALFKAPTVGSLSLLIEELIIAEITNLTEAVTS